MSRSNLPALPFVHEWKNRNHKKYHTSFEKHSIKFSIISKQSIPYLDHHVKKQQGLFKGFRKQEHQKQNVSYSQLNQQCRYDAQQENKAIEYEKKMIKLEKLRNKRNFEKHKLKLQYENLRINSIIQCATQQLLQKQNKMLSGMIY